MRPFITFALVSVGLTVGAPRSFAQSAPASRPSVHVEVGLQHQKAYEDKEFNGWSASLSVPLSLVSPAVKVAGVHHSSSNLALDIKERLLTGAAGIRLQRWRAGFRPWIQVLIGVSRHSQTNVLTSPVGTSTRTYEGTAVFAEVGAGVTADITRSFGLSASSGYVPVIEGYFFSGYQLSVGLTASLGGR